MITRKKRTLTPFSSKAKEVFENYQLVALRDKRTGFLIHISSTEEGLIWATDLRKKERYVFYKDANPVMKKYATIEGEDKYRLVFEGNMKRHPQYEIENPYIPMDHYKTIRGEKQINSFFQVNEFRVSGKAMKLCMNFSYFQRNLEKSKLIKKQEDEGRVLLMNQRVAA